jgi:SAM-dependent methyltransferase
MNSVAVLRTIERLGLTTYAKKLKKQLIRVRLWPRAGFGYAHRNRAYKLLSGRGLEIGALHCPANVPAGCVVEYCDAHSKTESEKLFPEIARNSLVEVTYLVNLDEDRLSAKVKPPYDFVIMNHVIEHVANPVAVIKELFTIIGHDGTIIVSAPDKDFTFDKLRPLTPLAHLLQEYHLGITAVEDDHYLDFIRGTAPHVLESGNEEMLATALRSARERREHAHVWSSSSFLEFLNELIRHFELTVTFEFISEAKDNHFECFVVLKKNSNIGKVARPFE